MAEKTGSRDWDVIILGTGLYGIQAARTYLDVHPQAKLLMLESDNVVGGTWGSNRNYNTFWTQTPLGMAEFSDRTLEPPPKADQYFGHFPARYVTAYLESYVDDHTYDGKTLRERIIFDATVKHVEKLGENWQVSCDGSAGVFQTSKLIDATGLTSVPSIPSIPGQADFQGLAIHHKEFGRSDILKNPEIQNIAVIGGSKSSADVVYSAVKAGKTVSWIIRKSGGGPSALFPVQGVGPYANSNQQLHTRLMGSVLPTPFGKAGMLAWFLQKTMIGGWLFGKVWEGSDRDLRALGDFSRKEGRENGFHNLEPDTQAFWANDSPGNCNQRDFFSTIAARVHIYRQDIARLESNAIVLAPTGKADSATQVKIDVDAIAYCTGWHLTSPHFSHSLADSLGLPVPLSELDRAKVASFEQSLDARNPTVLARFPILRPQQKIYKGPSQDTPLRLYKGMAPSSDAANHSIIFLGRLSTTNNFLLAEVQALWAVAYLDGKILRANPNGGDNSQLDEKEQREEEILDVLAWCRHRYPNRGQAGNWIFYDAVSYTDMLLEQLGLQSHLSKGWLRSFFAPCFASDLKGIVDEYKQVHSTT